jgi:ribosomal protein L16/L10AE
MLIPKNTKYRKAQKGANKSFRSGRYPYRLTYGSYGLKALTHG